MKLIEKVANSAKKDYKNFETGVLSSTERNSIPPPRQKAELNAHTEGPGVSGGTVMSQLAAKQRSDVTKVASLIEKIAIATPESLAAYKKYLRENPGVLTSGELPKFPVPIEKVPKKPGVFSRVLRKLVRKKVKV